MRSHHTVIVSIIVVLLGILFALHQQGLLSVPQETLMQRTWLRRLAFSQRNPTSRPVTQSFTSTISRPSAAMSSDSRPAEDDKPLTESNGQPLGLPQPFEAEARKLDLSAGQGSISMDHLGPLVVNKDGTLSRISNWDQMTEAERKNTLRILGKRNQLRTGDLKAKEADSEAGQAKA